LPSVSFCSLPFIHLLRHGTRYQGYLPSNANLALGFCYCLVFQELNKWWPDKYMFESSVTSVVLNLRLVHWWALCR
jgi:hypothetical protein